MLTEKQLEELKIRFTYHQPKATQNERYVIIRDQALQYAKLLSDLCPESRELSLALTKLEEVTFFANAAIARRE